MPNLKNNWLILFHSPLQLLLFNIAVQIINFCSFEIVCNIH